MTDTGTKNVVVLGSTGSVGRQALDVIRGMTDRFRIVGLAANSRWEDLARQVEEFRPRAVSLGRADAAARLKDALGRKAGLGAVDVLVGEEGLRALASREDVEVVLSAVSGAAGLPAAVAALESGKRLALANKEPVVMCGHILMDMARRGEGTIVPVDSEHSALFQLLQGPAARDVRRMVLTASGGPFRDFTAEQLARVTPEDALKHPKWRMGPKITIDSATLMNKALEIVEARWLFDVPVDRIRVLVHPQCIIHGILELVDGTTLAYMAPPDLRLPIRYALTYPGRAECVNGTVDLFALGKLELYEPDYEVWRALSLGFRVGRTGGTCGAVFSAANETAVRAFLDGRIAFPDIVRLVETVLDRHEVTDAPALDAVLAADAWARKEAESCLT